MPKNLYKFLPAAYAIQAVENCALKVSQLDKINDPFEFLPAIESEDNLTMSPKVVIDALVSDYLSRVGDHFGLISFSRDVSNPVLWAHYGDNHSGIALEFEFPTPNELFEIKYRRSRPVVSLSDLSGNFKVSNQPSFLVDAYSRKAPQWRYEAESRRIVNLGECIARNGLYFEEFEPSYLSRVILGMRCAVSERYMKNLLKSTPTLSHVQVTKATVSHSKFKISVEHGND